MSDPTLVSATKGNQASGLTHSVALPASVSAGQVLLVLFAASDSANSITWDNSTAGTWTSYASNYVAGSRTHEWRAKVADGTEGGKTLSIGMSLNRSSAFVVLQFGNMASGTIAQILEMAAAATGSSTSPNPPNAAPSWGTGADSMAVAVSTSGGGLPSAYPSGYSNGDYSTASGTTVGWATKTFNATDENPGVFTISVSNSWSAHTFVLKGASAATPTLTDVDTDETVLAGQTGITVTGTNLAGATAFVAIAGTREVAFSITNATSTTLTVTAPSVAAVIAANVPFGSVTFEVTTPDGTATLAGTLNPSSGYTVLPTTDISQAANAGCIYNGMSPAAAVSDQTLYENTTGTYAWDVDLDTQGIVSIDSGGDNRTDEFTYWHWDATDETWGTSADWEVTTTPVLSALLAAVTGQETADLSVTTNLEEGTVWFVVTSSATTPSHAQIKAGQDHTGAAAAFAGSDATPTLSTSIGATGLTAATTYYPHATQENASASPDAATPVSGDSFTTLAEPGDAAAIQQVSISIRMGM